MSILIPICIFFVFLGCVPVLTGLFQFILVALSFFFTNLHRIELYIPRLSILIPAWNEAMVIEATVKNLLSIKYDMDKLRIYVVDDGSTDQTPDIVLALAAQYPKNVFHVRRENGGEGKAHTLNYGLDVLWKTDWTEAVLIMDADVIYTPESILKMTRHLSDPTIGAVTAYIKEGSQNPNYVQRFIGFEYITATGVSRRAQNVLGFLACLSGGAQLHTRENLQEIGGKIFSDTLAEDTFTTFKTQLSGKRAIFEPNAIVYAEEPDSLHGLWKQRIRWGRGNVQVTQVFKTLWFNKSQSKSLGSFSMGLIWFSIFLMPLIQIFSTLALLTLYFFDPYLSWKIFRIFWILSGVAFLVITLNSFAVDRESAAKTWFEGILFPGILSLGIIAYSFWPPLIDPLKNLAIIQEHPWIHTSFIIFVYAWISLAMLVAWLAKEIERKYNCIWISKALLYFSGYGAFLCACTFASYIKELSGQDRTWDKTEKTGKVSSLEDMQ